MIQGKIWGTTQSIFDKANVEIHRITVKKGGFCSKHKHNFKYNAFYVECGSINVQIWKNDYKLCDETIVEKQQMTTVAPLEYHRFEALEDTVVYEIYWTETKDCDIVREDCGGVKKT